MFREHQPKIGQFARSSANNMARVYTFVLMTVQQSLHTVPEMMQDIDTRGNQSRFLWGFKIPAYDWIQEHKETVYETAMDISQGYADPSVRAKELLRYFATLPGLGLVKGGFMAQLCFGVSGCFDTHNLKYFDILPLKFKASRFKSASKELKTKLIQDYQALVKDKGGCEALWNHWCNLVAQKQPIHYNSAYDVSEMHCRAIGVPT